MKPLIFFVIFFTGILYPQGIGGGIFGDCELNIQVQNAPNIIVTFVLTPVGANWANNVGCEFPLYNDNATYISSLDGEENGYEDCWSNGYQYRFYWEPSIREFTECAQSTAGLVPLRSGFYRMDVWENDVIRKYVYFD
jgi:hypothetical protein